MSKINIDTIRAELFATLQAVKEGSIELDRARAINDMSKTFVDLAKVEVAYIHATQGEVRSDFIQPAKPSSHALPAEQMNGIKSITRHVLEG